MRRLASASILAAGLSAFGTIALAADLSPAPTPAPIYTKAPVPVPYIWSGFYGGANGGWVGSADNTINLTGTDTGTAGLGSDLANGIIPNPLNLGYSGFLAGGQLGYNWQTTNWVFGLEADMDWVSAKSSGAFPDAVALPPGGLSGPLGINASRELDWLGTFRGRIGYTPVAPLLVYATGGLAFGQHQLGIGVSDPTGTPPANLFNQTSEWSAGWTVGGGFEWMFARQWSLKAEYLYVDLGNISSTINYNYLSVVPGGTPQTSSLTATAHDTDNIVRGGINYHF
jgi:outer membrane immunogenic protein